MSSASEFEPIRKQINIAATLLENNTTFADVALEHLGKGLADLETNFSSWDHQEGKSSLLQDWLDQNCNSVQLKTIQAIRTADLVTAESVAHGIVVLRQILKTLEKQRRPHQKMPWQKIAAGFAVVITLLGAYTLYQKSFAKPKVWAARLYNGANPVGPGAFKSEEAEIDFDWSKNKAHPDLKSKLFSMVLVSCLELERPTRVGFSIGSDDGTRLFVGDSLIVNNWKEQAFATKTGEVDLPAGDYLIKIEYYNAGGAGSMRGLIGIGNQGFRDMDSFWLKMPVENSGEQFSYACNAQ